ncbi:hypothetical protein DEJ49_27760 [Streptomyces venezuelae]|uniref:Secreted protein n=1 Tax=Streptomyces venezuelae TaxID=54571 RepID=A0A5P2CTV1_STRVZ|nr:DUF6082 family protein [Streptomyces venezuelae]QES44289.1 hypothetical protein DEJ49_27760 [Streptomyces venezuelae]
MTTQKAWLRGVGPAAAAGLALTVGALGVLLNQQHQLKKLRMRLDRCEQKDRGEPQRHIDLANQQRLQWELLSKAMEDPTLAAVLDTSEGSLPHAKHRQFLFANALYTNALLAYRIGNVSRVELFGHLRGTLQNPIFREYWEVTRDARASLEENSVEAQVGRMVDHLIQDLDESDTEEWWVVGTPPE